MYKCIKEKRPGEDSLVVSVAKSYWNLMHGGNVYKKMRGKTETWKIDEQDARQLDGSVADSAEVLGHG